jgi:hypothetical protein
VLQVHIQQRPHKSQRQLGKSRLNRRIRVSEPTLWWVLFELLAQAFKERNANQTYIVDSLPMATCDNIRIRRCRLYTSEESAGTFRGYVPSKQRYFYGLQVHVAVSGAGERLRGLSTTT